MTTAAAPARVLMTADAVGGVWTYALELAAGLVGRGSRVILAVLGPEPSREQRAAAMAIPRLTVMHHPGRLEWMPGGLADLPAAAAWLEALRALFEPDVVHLNGYIAPRWSEPVPSVLVCHSCVRTWWRAVHGEDAPAAWDAYGAAVAASLAAADLVVAPTESFLSAIESTYGRQPHGRVIANGRSGPFRPAAVKQPLVLSCGRAWDRAKGVDLLDRLAEGLPWPVFLAGPLRACTGEAAPTPRHVRALGAVPPEEMVDWFSRAAIFVLPARYEPFGLSVLEAAMSGCALVLGDIPTLRELWDGAALFADPQDEAALRRAVLRLVGDPLLRHAMGARALLHARRYGAEPMTDGYLAAYRAALRRARERPRISGPTFSVALSPDDALVMH